MLKKIEALRVRQMEESKIDLQVKEVLLIFGNLHELENVKEKTDTSGLCL
jgi:hypothetical protein